MLRRVAEGVWVNQSRFCQSNAVIVQGKNGVLIIDAGITSDELSSLGEDIRELGLAVAGGFSTHPHWDHLLWHTQLGSVPRYGTAACSAAIKSVISQAGWQARVETMLPAELIGQIPLDGQFGQIRGLPKGADVIPWNGPEIRIIEHQAHAAGHAALLIQEKKVLIAGDMLSDLLLPILNLMSQTDPIEDYLSALKLLQNIQDVDILIPGHGSVGNTEQFRERIRQDRAYLQSLRDGSVPDDPRLDPSAPAEWGHDIHERQRKFVQS